MFAKKYVSIDLAHYLFGNHEGKLCAKINAEKIKSTYKQYIGLLEKMLNELNKKFELFNKTKISLNSNNDFLVILM